MAALVPKTHHVLRYCRDFTLSDDLPTERSFALRPNWNEKEASVNWLECLCSTSYSPMQICCSIDKAKALLRKKKLSLKPGEKLARMNVDEIINLIPKELGLQFTVISRPSRSIVCDPSHAVISGYYDYDGKKQMDKRGNLRVRKALAKLARNDLYSI